MQQQQERRKKNTILPTKLIDKNELVFFFHQRNDRHQQNDVFFLCAFLLVASHYRAFPLFVMPPYVKFKQKNRTRKKCIKNNMIDYIKMCEIHVLHLQPAQTGGKQSMRNTHLLGKNEKIK